jgi:predicted dehydrogenase
MSEQIRWGILSTANIGRRVIPAIHNSMNGVVAAVASRNIERAEAFAEEQNIPQVYGSYEDLLADDSIDAIYNPLPNQMHAEWSVKCAQAGKATLCEKPLASDADEAQMMVDVFAEKGILFAEAFMYRFHPQTQRVQQMVLDGAVGDVQVLNASFTFPIRSEENIRLSKVLAGGALMDVGCYCINVMRFITGEEPIAGGAFAQFGAETEVDETITGILHFPSGVLGHLDASLRTAFSNTYEIRGTTGRIHVPMGFVPRADQATHIHYWHDDKYDALEVPPVDQYQLMVEDFADALLNDRAPRFMPDDAVANMRVIDLLLRSAREHAGN